MIETGVRQFLLSWAVLWGKCIDPRTVEGLVQDGLQTLAKLGAPGDGVEQLLTGPFADPDMHADGIRATVRHLARVSPYYQALFTSLALHPKHFTLQEDMSRVPVTLKRTLRDEPRAFIARDARPYLSTCTAGRSGPPAEIWMSEREVRLWGALSALTMLLQGEITPHDGVQVNKSSHARAAVQRITMVCRLLGARLHVLGIIAPDESLDCLLKDGDAAPTILHTCPRYLGQVISAARRRGLGPQDFHLRQIDCSGAVLSSALVEATREVFGPVAVSDTFEVPEAMPLGGRVCDQGHLHYDTTAGFVEVLDLATGKTALPGNLGTLVITPFHPYRECMPVFRYDTRDVVRCLPDERLTCNQGAQPATSRILGKAEQVLRTRGQAVTGRDITEILEALPCSSLPARYGARVIDEKLELLVPETVLGSITAGEAERRFAAGGIALHVKVADEREILQLCRYVQI